MFGKKGVRKITPDERTFALCFARTMSVRQSCAAAGFERRTSFARASRLLERGDVRSLVRASILGESSGVFPAGSAAPAPGGSADEAPDAFVAPVSLEIVRDAPSESAVPVPESGENAAKGAESVCPTDDKPPCDDQPPTVPKASDSGVPAPSAAEETDEGELSFDRIERRILSEYEKIAFAPATKESDVKIADKLRALDQYRSIVERQAQRVADAASAERLERLAEAERSAKRESEAPLTVVYDYGDEREPR